jgi:hypothetical protein
MKRLILVVCIMVSLVTIRAQEHKLMPDSVAKDLQLVEAACGQCKFGMAGKGCELAVRIKDKYYLVDGTDIDSHGDAHAGDGFCNAVRKARVRGEITNNRFKAAYFALLPEAPKKEGTD